MSCILPLIFTKLVRRVAVNDVWENLFMCACKCNCHDAETGKHHGGYDHLLYYMYTAVSGCRKLEVLG